jgi:hypothetical protein
MLVDAGDKLLVAHRRLFERDAPRYFVGEVLDYQDGVVKITGYSFARDVSTSQVFRKADRRTKLVPLTTTAYIVYQLPEEIEIDAVEFDWSGGGLSLTAGGRVVMNLSELPHAGEL